MNDTQNVQQHCSICLLLGSTNRAKSHSTDNHRWSPYDHKVIGENISNSQNSVKVLPWVVDGAGGLRAGKTSGAGTRGVDLNAAVGGRTGYTDTNGGESSNN